MGSEPSFATLQQLRGKEWRVLLLSAVYNSQNIPGNLKLRSTYTDWPSVFTGPQSYNPATIPVLFRMGRMKHNKYGQDRPKGAIGNIELSKVIKVTSGVRYYEDSHISLKPSDMYNPFTFLNYSICVEQSCVYLNSSRFSWQKFSIFFLLLKYFNLLWCFCKILKYIWHINWLFLLDTNLFSLSSSCCWKTLSGSKVWVASWSWLIEQWLGASCSFLPLSDHDWYTSEFTL